MGKNRIKELVSIVVPVYNSAEIIKRIALDDQRIKYHKQDQKSGAAVARNKGIELAQGQYIAFLDSDDYWLHDKLQRELDLMIGMNCSIVYAATQMIDENDQKLGDYTPVPEWTDYKHLLKRTVIATSTVLLNMEKVGMFSMPLRRSGQDYDTWLLLLRRIDKAYGINEPLVLYRISPKSLSSNKFKSIKQVFDIQTKDEGLNSIYAGYNTLCFILYAFKKHFLKSKLAPSAIES